CTRTGFCPTFAHAKAGYKVLYDLGIGALVSLAFYFLVVRLPDYQRRQRLKRSLSAHYKAFRKGCIQTMLGVVHGKIDTRTAEAIIGRDKFRKYFQEPVGPRKSRWHDRAPRTPNEHGDISRGTRFYPEQYRHPEG